MNFTEYHACGLFGLECQGALRLWRVSGLRFLLCWVILRCFAASQSSGGPRGCVNPSAITKGAVVNIYVYVAKCQCSVLRFIPRSGIAGLYVFNLLRNHSPTHSCWHRLLLPPKMQDNSHFSKFLPKFELAHADTPPYWVPYHCGFGFHLLND